MKAFLLQAVVIIGAGLATGLAFSMNSKVQLHLPANINAGFPQKPTPAPTGSIAPTGQMAPTGQTAATGQVAPTGQPAPTDTTKVAPAANDLFISIAAAKTLFDSQAAIFIDARPKDEYLKSHIRGSMQLEKTDLDHGVPSKVDYLVGQEVVVYCHGEMCTDSENLIKRLAALNKGIGPFRIIKDGFPGWEKVAYPIESGPEVGFQ